MPMPPLLPHDEISIALRDLPGWEQVTDTLVKRFTFRDFASAVGFVSRLVPIADKLDHHPDVQIHWDTVELILWTHRSGGITERDIVLAHAIESEIRP